VTLLTALVAVQVTLGAFTVLSHRDVWINSLHVVCGALVLATSLVVTLRSWRVRFATADVRPEPTAARSVTSDSARRLRLQPDREARA
jgi:heme A synthase